MLTGERPQEEIDFEQDKEVLDKEIMERQKIESKRLKMLKKSEHILQSLKKG